MKNSHQGINYLLTFMDVNPKEVKEVNICLFVIMNTFNEICPNVPLRKAIIFSSIKCLEDYLQKFRVVNKVQSDHGRQFNNKRCINYLRNNNITSVFSPVRRPNSSMVERVHNEIGWFSRTYCYSNHRNWNKLIPIIIKY